MVVTFVIEGSVEDVCNDVCTIRIPAVQMIGQKKDALNVLLWPRWLFGKKCIDLRRARQEAIAKTKKQSRGWCYP